MGKRFVRTVGRGFRMNMYFIKDLTREKVEEVLKGISGLRFDSDRSYQISFDVMSTEKAFYIDNIKVREMD